MPELPEVETIAVGIRPHIVNRKIIEIELFSDKIRYDIDHDIIDNEGSVIDHICRRGKFLILNLSNGNSLIVHLGMSGQFKIENEIPEDLKHIHYVIKLDNGRYITYYDPRRFGMLDYYPTDKLIAYKGFANIGYEPFDTNLTDAIVHKMLQSSSSNIKAFLLNQKNICGIGNIYACEILFLAKINPELKVKQLSLEKAKLILYYTRAVLKIAIDNRGSTLRDYRQFDGQSGDFQSFFKVYGRDGDLCDICSSQIKKIKQLGRHTFFCSQCQK